MRCLERSIPCACDCLCIALICRLSWSDSGLCCKQITYVLYGRHGRLPFIVQLITLPPTQESCAGRRAALRRQGPPCGPPRRCGSAPHARPPRCGAFWRRLPGSSGAVLRARRAPCLAWAVAAWTPGCAGWAWLMWWVTSHCKLLCSASTKAPVTDLCRP